MRILWLATSSMQLQPLFTSLDYFMKVYFTSVSSMNLEPIFTGLEQSVGPVHLCRFDKGKEEQHHYEGEVDHLILEGFRQCNPDIVIYSGPAEGKCRPLLSTFHAIRERSKIINLVCDGGCPNWHPLLELYAKEACFDLTVNIDGNPNWPSQSHDITSPGPIDPRYYGKDIPKTVNFGFAGGQGSAERQEWCKRLVAESGLVIPERNETWGTYQGYADFVQSCKSVVNFGKTGSGKTTHLKYRMIEAALAKCLVYECENPITKLYFTPGEDYLEYKNLDDLLYWQKNKSVEHWEWYGNNLHKKVMANYGPDKLWKKVFSALNAPH